MILPIELIEIILLYLQFNKMFLTKKLMNWYPTILLQA